MKGLIYIATNLFNGRSYVGQTVTSLSRRKEKHFRDAATDSVNHFHLALMQYGKNAFEWKVLDEFSGTKEEVIHALNVAEEYHILKHRTMLDEYGYNATKGGYPSDKFADVIKKRALANYGGKAVLQYDLEGNFVREFESIAEVKRVMNAMGHKGTKFVGRMWRGYQWREKMNEYFPRKIDAYSIPKPSGKGVVVYTIDGKFYKAYSKQIDCWKDLGRGYKIRDSFEGVKVKSSQKPGYLVFKDNGDCPQDIKVEIIYPAQKAKSNYDNRVSVSQYSLEGEYIRSFDSIVEAKKATGVSKKGILNGCKKSLPYVVWYGTKFLWRYGKSRQRIDVIIKEKKKVEESAPEHRILQYDASGNFVKEWENVYKASKESGYSSTVIRRSLKGIVYRKDKAIWKVFSPEYCPKIDDVDYCSNSLNIEHRVIQYSHKGDVIQVWENMYQAALHTGESHNLIRKQCLGLPTKKKTPSVWKYYKNEALAV